MAEDIFDKGDLPEVKKLRFQTPRPARFSKTKKSRPRKIVAVTGIDKYFFNSYVLRQAEKRNPIDMGCSATTHRHHVILALWAPSPPQNAQK